MAEFSGGPKVGHKNKLYINEGTVASPSWTEIAEIGDVSLDGFETTMAELKRRSNNYTKGLPALVGMFTLGFRLVHGLGDAVFTVLQGLAFSQAAKQYAICNGDIDTAGTEGLTFAAVLSGFPWDQPLEDVAGHDVTLTHAYMVEASSEVDPTWLTVGS